MKIIIIVLYIICIGIVGKITLIKKNISTMSEAYQKDKEWTVIWSGIFWPIAVLIYLGSILGKEISKKMELYEKRNN